MTLKLTYQEEPGEPSPLEYIRGLRSTEHAAIYHKLELLAESPIGLWLAFKWLSSVENKIWKVRQGDHRVLLYAHGSDLVVLHALRKRGRKLSRADIDLANRRKARYLADNQ